MPRYHERIRSTATPPKNPQTAPMRHDVATALSRLARPAAFLVVSGSGGSIVTRSARKNGARHFRAVQSETIEILLGNGWLATEMALDLSAAPVRYTLSQNGKAALREYLLQPAPRQLRKAMVAEKSGKKAPATVSEPALLDQLRARRDANGVPFLTEIQVDAGKRFASDFNRANMQPRITQSWDPAGFAARTAYAGMGGMGERDASIQARARVMSACDCVGGELAGLLIDVCCLELRLGEVERNRQWQQGTARVILRLSLQRLAEHYGLVAPAVNSLRSKLSHWGDGAYRPDAAHWFNEQPEG